MSRIPEELKRGSFPLSYALSLGVGRRELRSGPWRRVARGVYRWAGQEADEFVPAAAVLGALPAGAALAGFSAARLLGLDVPLPRRREVVIPLHSGVSGRAQATVRRVKLDREDVTEIRGLPVTTADRTCFDLAGRLPATEGTVIADAMLYAGLLDLERWREYVMRHTKVAGVVGARRVLEQAEPRSESPMETRLRMLLVANGLPRPAAQVSLYDTVGRFAGRPDLYYREACLGIEYDGGNHRDRLTDDNRRQNRLHEIGVSLLRYSAPDLIERPAAIVAEVRAALQPSCRLPGNGPQFAPGEGRFPANGKGVRGGGARSPAA